MLIDEKAQTFGLPASLLVPIAARCVESIEKYVGSVANSIHSREGDVTALVIEPHGQPQEADSSIGLWTHSRAGDFRQRLHPKQQVWVHVDYTGYRKAYIGFGMPDIPSGYVLDHIQNREAIRLRDYSHPYLRLCPISGHVNTSAGVDTGGEGMEKEFLRSLPNQSKTVQNSVRRAINTEIVYADPMDLTQMLDILPGTQVLSGVGESLRLFYPEKS